MTTTTETGSESNAPAGPIDLTRHRLAATFLLSLGAILLLECSDAPNPPDAYDPDCSGVADQVMASCLLAPSMDPDDTKQPDTGTPTRPGQCRRAAERAYGACRLEQLQEETARLDEQRKHPSPHP